MSDKPKISVSWSGGKDSALALHRIISEGIYQVDHLHTVIDSETCRVGLHGVNEELIHQQAASLNIPLKKLFLEASDNHSNYERLMKDYYQGLNESGINHVLFGDIFLQDLKDYRDRMLGSHELAGVCPLWQLDTKAVIKEFISHGFRTVICAANSAYFCRDDLGLTIDMNFVENIHKSVDPCGENGEFHTFVYDGPIFKWPIELKLEEVVEKSYQYSRRNDDGSVDDLQSTFLFQGLNSY